MIFMSWEEMLTSAPEELVLMMGRLRRPNAPAGPTRSTAISKLVELTGPVPVTRDSMSMIKELEVLVSAFEFLYLGEIYSGVAFVILMSVPSSFEWLTIA